MSHIVQVVSMLDVMISFGDMVFQSSDVSGAVCSGVFELERRASGVSFWGAGSRVFTEDDREIVLLTGGPVD
jgi:crotonobetainyl-CoA:carnitine CoA-transferase CaiB-like acyl-CoA transferase